MNSTETDVLACPSFSNVHFFTRAHCFIHCSPMSIVLLCSLLSTFSHVSVTLFVFRVCPLFSCVHCFPVSTLLLCPLFSQCPLFSCVHCSPMSIVLLCSIFSCVHCSLSFSPVSLCYSHVSIVLHCPLSSCVHRSLCCSYMYVSITYPLHCL